MGAMSGGRPARAAAWIEALLLVFGLSFFVVFIWIVGQRVFYPYGLEWL